MKLSTKIRSWLGTAIDSATRVDLCTASEQARLASWELVKSKLETTGQRDLRLDELARTIATTVRTDAATQTGIRARYVLASYKCGLTAHVRFADYIQRVSVDAPANGGQKAKGDTLTALTQQLQAVIAAEQSRTGELHRLLLQTHAQWQETNQSLVQRTLMHVEKSLTQQATRIEGYETRHLEQLALTDRLLSMAEERQKAREQMELDKSKHNYTKEKLDMMVPVIINRLMGGGPGTGTPFFGEEMLTKFLGGLKPEQIDRLMQSNLLTQEQMMLVGELYMSYAQREEARKRGLNGASSPAPPPTETPPPGEGLPS
jgi:hypothetical protein